MIKFLLGLVFGIGLLLLAGYLLASTLDPDLAGLNLL
jgi:hypothetical protein